ncbi:MAG: sialidase family protein [Actinomycetota bacterium]
MRHRSWIVAAGLCLTFITLPSQGAPGLAVAPILISGASPYRDGPCGERPVVDSEHDQFLAVDPSNPENLIVAWDQDDNSGTVAAYSSDGGQSWNRSMLPRLTSCTSDAPDDYAWDPWVSIGADGAAYAIASLQDADAPALKNPHEFAVGVNVSHDGGRTWGDSVIVARELLPITVTDKTTIRADPHVAGRAYATWSSIALFPGTTSNLVSRTDDHGQTWSERVTIYAPPPDRAVFDSEIHVMADGSLLATFLEFPSQPLLLVTGDFQEGAFFVKATRSLDNGRTWSAPVTVTELASETLNDPDGGPPLDGVPFQDVSTSIASDGTVLVAWVDRSADPAARVLVKASNDGGATWAPPVTVADLATPAFIASVAAHPGGHWAATFYDLRDDVAGNAGTLVSAWLRETRDAGATWSEVALGGPFDARTLPDHVTSSPEWGDYFGLVALPGGFGATFNLGAPQAQVGATDVFFMRTATD